MKKLLIILMILIGGEFLLAQETSKSNDLDSNSQNSSAYRILDEIEKAISESQTAIISTYLSAEIYLSLMNGISGYYSSNQTFYVMDDFFKDYKVTSFNFDTINLNTLTPYAIGTYYFEHKGIRSQAKVYITIKQIGKNWQITQISIN